MAAATKSEEMASAPQCLGTVEFLRNFGDLGLRGLGTLQFTRTENLGQAAWNKRRGPVTWRLLARGGSPGKAALSRHFPHCADEGDWLWRGRSRGQGVPAKCSLPIRFPGPQRTPALSSDSPLYPAGPPGSRGLYTHKITWLWGRFEPSLPSWASVHPCGTCHVHCPEGWGAMEPR